MVTSLSSPGVEVREIDLTGIVPSVSTTEGAIAGVFRWGPVDETLLVDDEKTLVKRFEKPTNFNDETFFTAASFLAYGNKLYVTRVANTEGSSPIITANVETSNTTITLSSGNTANLSVGMVSISSSNGGLTVGATIAAITNSTAFTISSSGFVTVNSTAESLQFVTNTAFSAIANTGSVANLSYSTFSNEDVFDTRSATVDSDIDWVAKYPGEMGNSLRVSMCGNAAGFSSSINLASYGTTATLTAVVNANTANVMIIGASNTDNSTNATAIRALINVTDYIEVGNSTIGTQYLKVLSLANTVTYGASANTFELTTTVGNTSITSNNTTGLVAGMYISSANSGVQDRIVASVTNSTVFIVDLAPTVAVTADSSTVSPRAEFALNLEDKYSLSQNYVFTTANTSKQSFTRKWEFWNLINKAPGNSDYLINFGNNSITNDEVHVVVTDNDGKFTGTPGEVLEVYRNLSIATDAKTLDGAGNYFKTVINDTSNYIWSINAPSGITVNTAINLTSPTLDVTVQDFVLGQDGQDEDNIALSEITGGYDKYQSPETIDVSIILQGKARTFQLANYILDNICFTRKDCVAVVSPERGDVVGNPGNERAAIIDFRDNLRAGYDGSYGFLDSGYKYMYDKYNDINRWIPLNGDIAGLMVRTDRTNAPWFSPAGYNRGHIKNVIKLAYNPKQADRDILYRAGVNPVVTFPGQGTILYGDKTLLAKPSAFDRINVRRLFIVLEKAISKASKYTLFEFNDEFTRLQFKNLVVPYLRDVKGRRGITDFLVVCDSTNNTAEVIDRNEFVGDIYIKPARSINYIQLNFIAVRTGVQFNTIVGQF